MINTENVLRNRMGGALAEGDRAVLTAGISGVRTFPLGHIAVRQGQRLDVSLLLVRGMMTRHFDATDGRRHLVGVHVPGDFVDLHGFVMKELDHDVAALTEVTVAIIPHKALESMQRDYACLIHRLWFLTLLDGASHRQWIFRLSNLTAVERVAHFICEINARLMAIGSSDGAGFDLPMTQADIGEVCSLTNVHVSRVLRQLRELGLCTVRSARVEIHDLKGLAATGQFNPQYLYLNNETAARASGR